MADSSKPRRACALCSQFHPWPPYLKEQAPADGVCVVTLHAIPVTHDSGCQCDTFERLRSKTKGESK